MKGILKLLKGKKTYLVAASMAIMVFLQQSNIIDAETAKMIYGILGALGLGTLRSGVNNAK